MKTLLLYSNYTNNQLSYFDDWLDAFRNHPDFEISEINLFDKEGSNIRKKDINKMIERAELIILHHSMNGDTLKYLTPLVSPLKSRKGKLLSFVGNEVNLPSLGMTPKISILKELETDIIATQLLLEAGQWLYKECSKSKIISLPHALNPVQYKNVISVRDRKIDIGTRSARYGSYLGDNDRNKIMQYFQQNSLGLIIDLGLDKHNQKWFDRSGWIDFLNSCKATISTESGSFFLERDDKTVNQIYKYLKSKSSKFVIPNEILLGKTYQSIVRPFAKKIGMKWFKNQIVSVNNIDENTNFEEIYDKFFANLKKPPVYTKSISSRHFESIGTQTLQIMYPGRFNDILKAHEHYFELQRNHSNIDDLLSLLKNPEKIQAITSSVYDYVLKNHTHKHRLDTFLSHM